MTETGHGHARIAAWPTVGLGAADAAGRVRDRARGSETCVRAFGRGCCYHFFRN